MSLSKESQLAAASGHFSVGRTLASSKFASAYLDNFYAKSIIPEVTVQNKDLALGSGIGSSVIFVKDPVPEIHNYTLNQELQVSQLDIQTVQLTIGRAKYSNIKVDDVESKTIEELTPYLMRYRDQVSKAMDRDISGELLYEIPHSAAPCNTGRRAGKRSGMFDLGTLGAPVVLTRDNIISVIANMRTVLSEQNLNTDDLYVVLPTEAEALLLAHPTFINACTTGMKSTLATGRVINFFGLNFVFSNLMPQYTDGGKLTYTIFMGNKQATGFVTTLNVTEEISGVSNYFGKTWRSLQVYDFAVLYPEMISVLYATLEY